MGVPGLDHAATVDPLMLASVLAAFAFANAGAGIAAYVSIRVQLAVLQEITKRLESDVNNLAAMVRGDGQTRSSKI